MASSPKGATKWAPMTDGGWSSGVGLAFLGEVEKDSLKCLGVMNSYYRDEFPSMRAVGIKRVPLSLHEDVPLHSLG